MAAVRRWLTRAVAATVLPVTAAMPAVGADTGPVVLEVPAALPSELPDGLDLRGEAVQVRVQGDPGRARVDRVRLTGTAYVWRSSLP